MEFEEVEMEEDYLIEGDISDASPVKTSHEPAPKVARLVPKSEPSTSGRKIPIIRSAGAVVTPVRTAIRKPVQAPPSTEGSLRKVKSPVSKSVSSVVAEPKWTAEEPLKLCDRLSVIENKLALIVKKMKDQEDVIQKLVIPSKYHNFSEGDSSDSSLDETQPEEKEKQFKSETNVQKNVTYVKKLIIKGDRRVKWPVADTNDLWRLEALVQDDFRVRTELCELFDRIPSNDLYRYLRKNIEMLFRNTEKFTWSGRTAHNCKYVPPNTKPASSFKTVCLLLDRAGQNFPEHNRHMIESTCQKAMIRFNDNAQHRKMLNKY
ncbi:uncharacterized protein LOC129745632 isoform X4 [Uranotaenia lowii]|uniref:uncharacterized protein LOC129745632 isoform X4 n=1 Tax=Uranotaenia lowii TaxID=190385 RepID=UPI0024799478|nr:uncharacterized protein LOC129745632 isoform X4 [Uranotaenia lowii]